MTSAVRGESKTAKAVAETYFFETLVRIHRATKGEDFTRLKPVGSADPAFVMADRALVEGDIAVIADEISGAVRYGIEERFADVRYKRWQAESSVDEGRDCVAAYVRYTHFIEGADHLVSHGADVKHREICDEIAEAGH